MRRLAPVALIAMALAMPQAAHAGFTATFDAGTGVLSLTGTSSDDSLEVVRQSDGTITLRDDEGTVPIAGGTPNVTNTNTIEIDAGAGNDDVTVDARLGPLAPGSSPEPGGLPEIELIVNMEDGNDVFILTDGVNAALLTAGQLGTADAGLKLNTDTDADDVRTNAETIQLDLGGGNDIATGEGGPGFTGPLNRVFIVNGGAGNDALDAGALTSILNGDEGNDDFGIFAGANTVNGGAGTNRLFALFNGTLDINQNGGVLDLMSAGLTGDVSQLSTLSIQGGNGNDTLDAAGVVIPILILGLGGNDTFFTGDGGDLLIGGTGNDQASAGPGDDDLVGDQGDDVLRGQAGDDSADGGDGTDSCEAELRLFCEITIQDPIPGSGDPALNPPTLLPSPLAEDPFADGSFMRRGARAVERAGIDGLVENNGFVMRFGADAGLYVFNLDTSRRGIFQRQSAGASGRKRIVLAKARRRVTTAGRVRVKVKLTRQGRRVLRRARRVRVTLRARYTSPGGERFSASRRITLRRK